MATQPLGMLDTAALWHDRKYTDVVIKCGSHAIKCHKIIICRWPYFDKLCGADSAWQEAKQEVVELKDDIGNAVEAMIAWMYTGKIERRNQDQESDWLFYLNVHITAEKYMVEELQKTAYSAFNTALQDLTSPHEIFEAIGYIRRTIVDDAILDTISALEQKHISEFLAIPDISEALDRRAIVEYCKALENAKQAQTELIALVQLVCVICGSTRWLADGDVQAPTSQYCCRQGKGRAKPMERVDRTVLWTKSTEDAETAVRDLLHDR